MSGVPAQGRGLLQMLRTSSSGLGGVESYCRETARPLVQWR